MALPFSYNIRNVIVRWRVTTLAIGAIALVVAVLIVLISMAQGFRLALQATGSTDNAVLTQRFDGRADLGHLPRQRERGDGRRAGAARCARAASRVPGDLRRRGAAAQGRAGSER